MCVSNLTDNFRFLYLGLFGRGMGVIFWGTGGDVCRGRVWVDQGEECEGVMGKRVGRGEVWVTGQQEYNLLQSGFTDPLRQGRRIYRLCYWIRV